MQAREKVHSKRLSLFEWALIMIIVCSAGFITWSVKGGEMRPQTEASGDSPRQDASQKEKDIDDDERFRDVEDALR